MRECVYEKNAKFDSTYRAQKNTLVPQIVRSVSIKCYFFRKCKLANFIVV
jgi:hypothetical protein